MTWPAGYDPWGSLALFEAGRRAWFGDTQRRGRPLDRVAATEPHELPRAGAERVLLDDGDEDDEVLFC